MYSSRNDELRRKMADYSKPKPILNSLPEEIRARIKQEFSKRNIGEIHQIALNNGPRTFKFASIIEILNDETGLAESYTLRLDAVDRLKAGYFGKSDSTLILESSNFNEIVALRDFLIDELGGNVNKNSAVLHMVNGKEISKLDTILENIPSLSPIEKIEILKKIIQEAAVKDLDIKDLIHSFSGYNQEVIKAINIASKFVEYKKGLKLLEEKARTANEHNSQELTDLIKHNIWILGSGYSEIMTHIDAEKVDFILRKTIEGVLEVNIFYIMAEQEFLIADYSHDSYYPSTELSRAIGYANRNISKIKESSLNSKTKFYKIQARVFVNSKLTDDQLIALRNFNETLTNIEVLTFDQLISNAREIVLYFEKSSVKVLREMNVKL